MGEPGFHWRWQLLRAYIIVLEVSQFWWDLLLKLEQFIGDKRVHRASSRQSKQHRRKRTFKKLTITWLAERCHTRWSEVSTIIRKFTLIALNSRQIRHQMVISKQFGCHLCWWGWKWIVNKAKWAKNFAVKLDSEVCDSVIRQEHNEMTAKSTKLCRMCSSKNQEAKQAWDRMISSSATKPSPTQTWWYTLPQPD